MKWTRGEPGDQGLTYALRHEDGASTAVARWDSSMSQWAICGDSSQPSGLANEVWHPVWPHGIWEHVPMRDLVAASDEPEHAPRPVGLHARFREVIAEKLDGLTSTDKCQQVLLLAKALAALRSS